MRGPTHWAFVEREGEDAEDTGPRVTCRSCSVEGPRSQMILHPDPDASDGRRVICSACQGRVNAVRSGMVPR